MVLTISSAGCNVLDYLCEGPKKIIAVDMNLAQLHTLELKLAGIRCLTQEQFFAIWGRSDYKVFTEVYQSKLRPLLQKETAEFWDANTNLFRDNFMYAGTSGLMAIMTSIGRKKIIYNISWEDPAIDHTVMHMKVSFFLFFIP